MVGLAPTVEPTAGDGIGVLCHELAGGVGLFRIYRYLVVLELLVGAVLVIALSHWIGQWRWRQILTGLAILAVALGVGTVYPDWGRRPWSDPFARSNIAATVTLQGEVKRHYMPGRIKLI
ncbi:hypothetical protein IPG36_01600 [bacterium]|nr:MAG: hypothetical protein IPG36_01600 [bacterium]